jgi:hypothetical protein
MILDEYGAEGRCQFSVLNVFLATMLDPYDSAPGFDAQNQMFVGDVKWPDSSRQTLMCRC